MTNAEKFKTTDERAKDDVCAHTVFHWLDQEAEEEKPLPCPYCGGECRTVKNRQEQYVVGCDCCCYASQDFSSSREAIAAHNRVARAVAGKKEEK